MKMEQCVNLDRVNVMEFNGELYISVYGEPVVSLLDLHPEKSVSIEQCSILEKLGYDLDNATHCWVYDDSTGYKFVCLSSDAVDYHSTTTVITPTWNLQECMYEILKKCIGYTCQNIGQRDFDKIEQDIFTE